MTENNKERKEAADKITQLCIPKTSTAIIIDGNSLTNISRRTCESLDVSALIASIESRTPLSAKTWFRLDDPNSAKKTTKYSSWLRSQGISPTTAIVHNSREITAQRARRDVIKNIKHKISEGNTILFGSSKTSILLAGHIIEHTNARLIWVWDDMSPDIPPNVPKDRVFIVKASEIIIIAQPPHKYLHDFHRSYSRFLSDQVEGLESPVSENDLEIMVDKITASQDALISCREIGITNEAIEKNDYKTIFETISKTLKAE